MNERNMCGSCHQQQVAINYIRNGKTYFRAVCGTCARKGKRLKPSPPQWYKSGYRKKPHCDMCGFKAEVPEKQLGVFHVDGNKRNTDRSNLKTICLNCQQVVYRSRLPWRAADLVPDF